MVDDTTGWSENKADDISAPGDDEQDLGGDHADYGWRVMGMVPHKD